jgi:hypothetical protein
VRGGYSLILHRASPGVSLRPCTSGLRLFPMLLAAHTLVSANGLPSLWVVDRERTWIIYAPVVPVKSATSQFSRW